MKQKVSPAVAAIVIVVVLAVIAFFGYRKFVSVGSSSGQDYKIVKPTPEEASRNMPRGMAGGQ